jgi:PAS domain S-box-containing protein
MVGYPSEDILDKPFALFTHPDDIPSSMEKFKNASVQPHMTIDLEFRIVSKDKNIIWIHTNPVPIIVNGYPMGFSAILHDTTAHKRTEADLKETYATIQKSLEGTIRAVAKMAELRDPYTAGHQLRVAKLSAAIAREMHLPEDQINCIEIAANIHDVGKVYVPSEILSKPGKLTDLEFKMPMTHPQGSYDILRNIEFPWPIAQIVLQHHERMDGSGYPQGLKGEDIVLEARVLAVADVVEAMASHRPYRAALGLNEALEEIVMNKGKLYDAEIVEACERTFAEIEFEFE